MTPPRHALAALALAAACNQAAATPDRAEVAAPRAGVPRPARPESVVANGQVEAFGREVELSAPAPGVIARLVASLGTTVPAGAPLVELVSDVERADVAEAEAALREAEALYLRARRGARPEEREAADASASAARARSMRSQDERARLDRLAGAGAAAEADRARAAWAAEADLAAARQAAAEGALVRLGPRAEDLTAAAARRDVALARLARARAALARLTLHAPTEGAVLRWLRRPGERVAPDEGPALVFGDARRLQVRVAVDEREVARVRVGAAASVTADAADGAGVPARVVERGLVALPRPGGESRFVDVVVALDGRGALVPGMRAVARIEAAP